MNRLSRKARREVREAKHWAELPEFQSLFTPEQRELARSLEPAHLCQGYEFSREASEQIREKQ